MKKIKERFYEMKREDESGVLHPLEAGDINKACRQLKEMTKAWRRRRPRPRRGEVVFREHVQPGPRVKKYISLPSFEGDPIDALLLGTAVRKSDVKLRGCEHLTFGDKVVTAVCIFEIIESGRFLLTLDYRKQVPGWPPRWGFVGGGREPYETVQAALAREIKEETGRDPRNWEFSFVGHVRLYSDAVLGVYAEEEAAVFYKKISEEVVQSMRKGREQMELRQGFYYGEGYFFDPDRSEYLMLLPNQRNYFSLFLQSRGHEVRRFQPVQTATASTP